MMMPNFQTIAFLLPVVRTDRCDPKHGRHGSRFDPNRWRSFVSMGMWRSAVTIFTWRRNSSRFPWTSPLCGPDCLWVSCDRVDSNLRTRWQ